ELPTLHFGELRLLVHAMIIGDVAATAKDDLRRKRGVAQPCGYHSKVSRPSNRNDRLRHGKELFLAKHRRGVHEVLQKLVDHSGGLIRRLANNTLERLNASQAQQRRPLLQVPG